MDFLLGVFMGLLFANVLVFVVKGRFSEKKEEIPDGPIHLMREEYLRDGTLIPDCWTPDMGVQYIGAYDINNVNCPSCLARFVEG